jgi:hypothetical protein
MWSLIAALPTSPFELACGLTTSYTAQRQAPGHYAQHSAFTHQTQVIQLTNTTTWLFQDALKEMQVYVGLKLASNGVVINTNISTMPAVSMVPVNQSYQLQAPINMSFPINTAHANGTVTVQCDTDPSYVDDMDDPVW